MSFFSIIIPCFNADKTISATLKSIQAQSFKDFEVIVVDGKSDDNTVDLLKQFEDIISYTISEEDDGVYDAINKGIAVSKGQYIYILGSDDVLHHQNVLQQIHHIASRFQTRVIYGNVHYTSRSNAMVPDTHISSYDWKLKFKNTLHQQGVFYHHSLFPEYLFLPHYTILGDYHMHLRLQKDGIQARNSSLTVASCEAAGISKNFHWSLYVQEFELKRSVLTFFWFALNLPWIPAKYLAKKIFQR